MEAVGKENGGWKEWEFKNPGPK